MHRVAQCTLLLLLLLFFLKLVHGQTVEPEALLAPQGLQLPQCSSESQLVQCSQMPYDTLEAFQAYVQCCQLYEPIPLPPAAQAAEAQATATQAVVSASTYRPDLDLTASGRFATPPNYWWDSSVVYNGKPVSSCVAKTQLLVPTFSEPQQVVYTTVTAAQLTNGQIQRVSARALALTYKTSGPMRRAALRMRLAARRTAPASTTFVHPAALMSPAEVALMQYRLNGSISPQTGARDSLLSGAGVSVQGAGTSIPSA